MFRDNRRLLLLSLLSCPSIRNNMIGKAAELLVQILVVPVNIRVIKRYLRHHLGRMAWLMRGSIDFVVHSDIM